MAGKTFKREQHKFLVSDLEEWLGRERLRDLCVGTTLTFENLKKLIGVAAMIEIELKECGQLEKFRNIRSIRPCKNEGSAPTAGIDLKSLSWKWN